MDNKEKNIIIKRKIAKLLTQKNILESRIHEINKEIEEYKQELFSVKEELLKEEKERLRRL